MSDPRLIRSLGVDERARPAFFEYEEAPLADGEFAVDTLHTGFSAGTELTFFKGSNPYLSSTWDPELAVFRPEPPASPSPMMFLGYMEVGRVVETKTPAASLGEVVAAIYGHKTGHVLRPDADFFLPLPPDLDPVLGIYVAQMGPICANGLLHAAAELGPAPAARLGDGVRGRRVLVMGGGVVGLLTGLFALHHGAAEVALADPTPARLEAAAGLGMVPVDDAEGQAWSSVKGRWRHGPGDRGADVVFQCRGQSAALANALRALRPQGTVVDLAFYQGGAPDVRLGEEFHHNGLTIRCAQISRVPRGFAPAWDRHRLAAETVELLQARGQAVRQHVITDVIAFDDAPSLIDDLCARRRHVIQAVFEGS